MSDDPTRWRDEPGLDAELRALLDAGAAELPHPEQLDRLEARLFPPILPGGGGGAPPAASLAPKAALAIGAAAALGAVAWIAVDAASPATGPERAGAAAVAAAEHAGAADPIAARSDPIPHSVSAAEPGPTIDTIATDTGATTDTAPAPPRHPESGRAPAQDPAAELALLDAAQAALATSPTRALALAQQHARRFPDGALAQEREVIVVDALLRLDRATEAARRAARFRARWPSSAHLRRIDVLLRGP